MDLEGHFCIWKGHFCIVRQKVGPWPLWPSGSYVPAPVIDIGTVGTQEPRASHFSQIIRQSVHLQFKNLYVFVYEGAPEYMCPPLFKYFVRSCVQFIDNPLV